jgi:rare lipoprotein A (peptidoglycan hydrolase)
MHFVPCTITHYHGSKTASGRPFGGHNIAASSRYPFGSVILIRRRDKVLRLVVADRGRISSRSFDLPDSTFYRFAGRHGRVKAEYTIVTPKRASRNAKRHGHHPLHHRHSSR